MGLPRAVAPPFPVSLILTWFATLHIQDVFLMCCIAVHLLSTQRACECTGGFGHTSLDLPKVPFGRMISQPDAQCAEPVKDGNN